MIKFPKTIAAVQKRDRCMWEIGDALIAECGAPSQHGVNDGSRKRLEQVANELEHLHISDYPPAHLARIREVAFKFPRSERNSLLSWTAHQSAGKPEILEKIVERTPKDRKMTVEYVRAARPIIEHEERSERRASSSAPKTDTSIPVSKPKPMYLADLAGAAAEVLSARASIKDAAKFVEPWLNQVEPDLLDDLVEKLISLSNEALALKDKINKLTNKRGHLSTIQGGKAS